MSDRNDNNPAHTAGKTGMGAVAGGAVGGVAGGAAAGALAGGMTGPVGAATPAWAKRPRASNVSPKGTGTAKVPHNSSTG